MSEEILTLTGVGKRFGERVLFSDVNISIARGEVLVIFGDSGVGKTTLLRAIAGLAAFDGTIEVFGEPVDPSNRNSGRSRRVLVLQQANLWDHLTALDNVALVRRLLHKEEKRLARTMAMSYLDLIEVEGIALQYPQSLSGGEQQRVSLARGLAAETPLVLLDEVTSQIDSQRRRIVARVIRSMAERGRAIVLVTHDLETAHLLDGRILRLTPTGLRPAEERS